VSLWNQTGNVAGLPALLEVVECPQAAGAIIVNGTEFPHCKNVLSATGWTWSAGPSPFKNALYRVNVDFYNNIHDYLGELENTHVKSLEDIFAFNIQYANIEGGIPGTVAGFRPSQDAFLDSVLLRKG
jgi:amidase